MLINQTSDKGQAQISSRNLHGEIFSLNPSSLITLFEIDVSELAFYRGVADEQSSMYYEGDRVFRFHNNTNLFDTNIIWRGNVYSAAPIKAEGFELSSRGVLPVPKLSLAVDSNGIPALALFKAQLREFGDLSGAKVTRIRTLLKFLDRSNFENGENDSEDRDAEFPRDVFYIDKKSIENKTLLEFELGSVLDVEGVKLPARLVIATRCNWTYRGEGCLYENKLNRVDEIHGSESFSTMPNDAPPVANINDERILDLLPFGSALTPKSEWRRNTLYLLGDYVWIERDGIKYYFVAKVAVPINEPPPNDSFWVSDQCSKLISGCKCRWGLNSPGVKNGNPHNNCLPYGGFPATNKLR